MNAKDIKGFLAEKYSGTFAFFEEFRPFTGFAGNCNQIDAIAVGLYDKDDRIIAFEIKTDRQDFFKDVSQFKHKHRFALELSHEFYYVCPWGLIEKNEVPEITGLFYINKGHKLQRIKQAQRRELDSIPLKYFQAFAKNFGAKIEHAKVPLKWIGKEITQEEFKNEIQKETENANKYLIKREAEELFLKKAKEEKMLIYYFAKLTEIAGYNFCSNEENFKKITETLKDGLTFKQLERGAKSFINHIKQVFQLE